MVISNQAIRCKLVMNYQIIQQVINFQSVTNYTDEKGKEQEKVTSASGTPMSNRYNLKKRKYKNIYKSSNIEVGNQISNDKKNIKIFRNLQNEELETNSLEKTNRQGKK